MSLQDLITRILKFAIGSFAVAVGGATAWVAVTTGKLSDQALIDGLELLADGLQLIQEAVAILGPPT